jgi:hypothetical protein
MTKIDFRCWITGVGSVVTVVTIVTTVTERVRPTRSFTPLHPSAVLFLLDHFLDCRFHGCFYGGLDG